MSEFNNEEYIKYGPGLDNKAINEGEAGCAPIDIPGSVKEPVFQFFMRDPEYGHVIPVHGKVSQKFRVVTYILVGISFIESVILSFIDKGADKYWDWLMAGMILLIVVIAYIWTPIRRRKNHRAQIAAGELEYNYAFYDDSVTLKNKSAEFNIKYDTAQYYSENDKALVVMFQFGKHIIIDKSKCTEEQLNFIRSIVSSSKQREVENKTLKRRVFRTVLLVVMVMWFGFVIYKTSTDYTKHTAYNCTTYDSFCECVEQGTIKDVEIIRNKYIEYTFTGNGTNERYYTVCSDNMDEFTDFLDKNHINWEYK